MATGAQREPTEATPRFALDECVSKAVLGLVVGFILLASWLVVGVSLLLLYRKGLEHGLTTVGATALAVPTTFIPAWRTWAGLRRSQSLVGALIGHLWVLNGSVGYAILVLVLFWFRDALVPLAGGVGSWPLAFTGVAGFVALLVGLVGVNLWFFRRWRRTED
ncbi:MAG: hypothetical protein HY689_08445 [Chloroflexi bacterium]|nr:hypothetical protein [Chloroflexota bacterium]